MTVTRRDSVKFYLRKWKKRIDVSKSYKIWTIWNVRNRRFHLRFDPRNHFSSCFPSFSLSANAPTPSSLRPFSETFPIGYLDLPTPSGRVARSKRSLPAFGESNQVLPLPSVRFLRDEQRIVSLPATRSVDPVDARPRNNRWSRPGHVWIFSRKPVRWVHLNFATFRWKFRRAAPRRTAPFVNEIIDRHSIDSVVKRSRRCLNPIRKKNDWKLCLGQA